MNGGGLVGDQNIQADKIVTEAGIDRPFIGLQFFGKQPENAFGVAQRAAGADAEFLNRAIDPEQAQFKDAAAFDPAFQRFGSLTGEGEGDRLDVLQL